MAVISLYYIQVCQRTKLTNTKYSARKKMKHGKEIGSGYNKGLFSIIKEHKYSEEMGLFCVQKELKIHSLFHIHIILQISNYQREEENQNVSRNIKLFLIKGCKNWSAISLPINTIGNWSIMKTHQVPRKAGFSSR